MNVWEYQGDWSCDALAKIVRHLIRYCPYFVLTLPKSQDNEAMELLDPLLPYLIARRDVSEWPGTILLSGETRQMLKFELNENSVEVVIGELLPRLFQLDPPIEDISFLRRDGRPLFITITHERDAFFKVQSSEVELITAVGTENLLKQGIDERPDECY